MTPKNFYKKFLAFYSLFYENRIFLRKEVVGAYVRRLLVFCIFLTAQNTS